MNFKKGLGEEAFEKLAALRQDSAKVAQEGGYNGYTNYETWAVCLWIDNERGEYEYWKETAEDIKGGRDEGESPMLSSDENVVHMLADMVKDTYEEHVSELNLSGVFADLMNGALSEVNWKEVAENILAE
jgi:hypothetical protein